MRKVTSFLGKQLWRRKQDRQFYNVTAKYFIGNDEKFITLSLLIFHIFFKGNRLILNTFCVQKLSTY